MGVMLNYGQIPLVKSRYLKHINNEEHPCGENVVVAIMCYSGYNVEDSILFNKKEVIKNQMKKNIVDGQVILIKIQIRLINYLPKCL